MAETKTLLDERQLTKKLENRKKMKRGDKRISERGREGQSCRYTQGWIVSRERTEVIVCFDWPSEVEATGECVIILTTELVQRLSLVHGRPVGVAREILSRRLEWDPIGLTRRSWAAAPASGSGSGRSEGRRCMPPGDVPGRSEAWEQDLTSCWCWRWGAPPSAAAVLNHQYVAHGTPEGEKKSHG